MNTLEEKCGAIIDTCNEILGREDLINSEKLSYIRRLLYHRPNYKPEKEIKYTIRQVETQINRMFGVKREHYIRRTRKIEIVLIRQMAHYKCVKFTAESLASIGSYFGNLDHCTVINSCKAINDRLATDKLFKEMYGPFLNS